MVWCMSKLRVGVYFSLADVRAKEVLIFRKGNHGVLGTDTAASYDMILRGREKKKKSLIGERADRIEEGLMGRI